MPGGGGVGFSLMPLNAIECHPAYSQALALFWLGQASDLLQPCIRSSCKMDGWRLSVDDIGYKV